MEKRGKRSTEIITVTTDVRNRYFMKENQLKSIDIYQKEKYFQKIYDLSSKEKGRKREKQYKVDNWEMKSINS